mmetsp:Transcript_18477/g.53439  ORF Transcript_18477/g.53439 Transcript_18477/m.53439 type:complete len:345 (+) Transcript_18477:255-1289(+)
MAPSETGGGTARSSASCGSSSSGTRRPTALQRPWSAATCSATWPSRARSTSASSTSRALTEARVSRWRRLRSCGGQSAPSKPSPWRRTCVASNRSNKSASSRSRESHNDVNVASCVSRLLAKCSNGVPSHGCSTSSPSCSDNARTAAPNSAMRASSSSFHCMWSRNRCSQSCSMSSRRLRRSSSRFPSRPVARHKSSRASRPQVTSVDGRGKSCGSAITAEARRSSAATVSSRRDTCCKRFASFSAPRDTARSAFASASATWKRRSLASDSWARHRAMSSTSCSKRRDDRSLASWRSVAKRSSSSATRRERKDTVSSPMASCTSWSSILPSPCNRFRRKATRLS